jgi:hypothetical protein
MKVKKEKKISIDLTNYGNKKENQHQCSQHLKCILFIFAEEKKTQK